MILSVVDIGMAVFCFLTQCVSKTQNNVQIFPRRRRVICSERRRLSESRFPGLKPKKASVSFSVTDSSQRPSLSERLND